LEKGGEREEKRQRHQDVANAPMVVDAEGAPDQVQVHGGDGVVLPSELAQDNGPLLPLDLVYRLILPHAFDTPTQAASFCLVCGYFREATSRLWFWTDGAWMLQLVVMRIRLTPFNDENERGALLHMLPTIFKACDVIQAVGLKETIGALVGHSPRRRRPFGEVLLQVFEAGDGNRSSGVYFGSIENGDRVGKAAVYYTSGNSFFGTFFNDVFHGPDCTFRWNCGMVFRGQIEFNLRVGPGRLELVDGSVFECNFSAMPDDRLEEQHGDFSAGARHSQSRWISNKWWCAMAFNQRGARAIALSYRPNWRRQMGPHFRQARCSRVVQRRHVLKRACLDG
jgi:hypothetical protein